MPFSCFSLRPESPPQNRPKTTFKAGMPPPCPVSTVFVKNTGHLPCNSRFDVIHYITTTKDTDGAPGNKRECENNTRRRNGVRGPARRSLWCLGRRGNAARGG